MALTGRQLKDRDDGLNMNTVLDGITSKKPFYDEARPALYAIIWGFCREGRLVPVDEDGNTLENSVVLDQDRLSTTRLKLLPREPIGEAPRSGWFQEDDRNRHRWAHQPSGSEPAAPVLAYWTPGRRPVGSRYRRLLECCLRNPRSLYRGLTDRISTTTERLSVVRSQGDGLGDAIEQTNEVQDWFDEVRDVWNRRLASLYRFDVQLTAGNGRFEWADDDAQSEITAQRDALVDFDGELVDDRRLESVRRRHDIGTGYRAPALLGGVSRPAGEFLNSSIELPTIRG